MTSFMCHCVIKVSTLKFCNPVDKTYSGTGRFLLIGLEKFEKVLQIIIDYDDSTTR